MATTTINTEQQLNFEDGGTFEITDGANTYVLARIEPGGGGLEWVPGMREQRFDTDQGTMQAPLLGNDRPTKLKIKCRYTSDVAADSILTLLTTEGTGGLCKEYSVVVRYYTNRGGSTGVTLTFATATPMFDDIRVTGGKDFDTIEAGFSCRIKKPTIASF